MDRGNAASPVFNTPDDYRLFVDLLEETVEKWGIAFHTFSLMPNHKYFKGC